MTDDDLTPAIRRVDDDADEQTEPAEPPATATPDGGELPEETQALVDTAAEMFGLPADSIPDTLRMQLGLDVREVDPEDAKIAERALETGDMDTFEDVATQYAPEAQVQQFCDVVRQNQPESDGSNDAGGEADSEPSVSDSEGGVNRSEVERMIESEVESAVPDADDIARSLKRQMDTPTPQPQQPNPSANGQGGGQGQGNGMQSQLAMQLAKQFLGSQGGGEMAELGQEVQKAAMQSFLRDLQKPSLGDMVEMQFYSKMAPKMSKQMLAQAGFDPDGESADMDMGDWFGGMDMELDSEDDDNE